jgi:hypothetical protein
MATDLTYQKLKDFIREKTENLFSHLQFNTFIVTSKMHKLKAKYNLETANNNAIKKPSIMEILQKAAKDELKRLSKIKRPHPRRRK